MRPAIIVNVLPGTVQQYTINTKYCCTFFYFCFCFSLSIFSLSLHCLLCLLHYNAVSLCRGFVTTELVSPYVGGRIGTDTGCAGCQRVLLYLVERTAFTTVMWKNTHTSRIRTRTTCKKPWSPRIWHLCDYLRVGVHELYRSDGIYLFVLRRLKHNNASGLLSNYPKILYQSGRCPSLTCSHSHSR